VKKLGHMMVSLFATIDTSSVEDRKRRRELTVVVSKDRPDTLSTIAIVASDLACERLGVGLDVLCDGQHLQSVAKCKGTYGECAADIRGGGAAEVLTVQGVRASGLDPCRSVASEDLSL
jgi:hypothetical protein